MLVGRVTHDYFCFVNLPHSMLWSCRCRGRKEAATAKTHGLTFFAWKIFVKQILVDLLLSLFQMIADLSICLLAPCLLTGLYSTR